MRASCKHRALFSKLLRDDKLDASSSLAFKRDTLESTLPGRRTCTYASACVWGLEGPELERSDPHVLRSKYVRRRRKPIPMKTTPRNRVLY